MAPKEGVAALPTEGSGRDGVGVRERKWPLRARWTLLWVLPIIGLPVAGALTIQALESGVSSRYVAAADLQNLEADVNLATLDAGWAVALHWPFQRAQTTLQGAEVTVRSDLERLQSEWPANPVMTSVRPAVDAYMRTLEEVVTLFGPDAPPVNIASEDQALVQFSKASVLIDAGTAALAGEAAATSDQVQVAVWVLVVGESALLTCVLWIMSQRRRLLAMSQTRARVLADSERTFRLLFEENPLPTLISDPHTGRFLAANKAAQSQYGYTADAFLSLTTADLSVDKRRTREREPLSPGRRQWELIAFHRTRGGRRFDAEVSETQLDYRGHAAILTVVRDVTAHRQLEAKLLESALHDPLTGLANRRLFVERFDQAQASRVRHDDGLAVITIDMDGFKSVNDRHGHGIGDDVLRVVARRIRSVVRAQDTVARFGGDEFVLLIDGATALTVGALAQRLVAWLAHPYDILDTTVDISGSLGIALIDPMTGADEAMRASDIAMYAAKESGRQSYRMYDAQMRSAILERLATARELQQALDRGEFNLWYQPIVSRADHHWAVNNVEALIRWNHPERGIVSPAEFIPIAEQTGSIVAIGTWVLRAGCAQIAEWQRRDRRVGLHVNVSGLQVKQPDFVALVKRIVAESGIDASDLILELTETALLEDLNAAQKPLNELRAMGIRIALDDFGSGYSSLTYLSQLPIDIVKIDRSFVANLGEPDKLSTLATIMRLMENLQVTVIAEGVETAEELGRLLSLGVDAIQGYYFSRPVPAPDLAEAIERCERIAAPDPCGLDRCEPGAHQRSRIGGVNGVHPPVEPTMERAIRA